MIQWLVIVVEQELVVAVEGDEDEVELGRMIGCFHNESISTNNLNSHARLLSMPQSKRICIIGAGPAGLSALQAVLKSQKYSTGLWEPTLFEQKANVGGICCGIMSLTYF